MPWDPSYGRTPLVWRVCHLGFLAATLLMMATVVMPGNLKAALQGILPCFVMPTLAIAFIVALEKVLKPWSYKQSSNPTRCRVCNYELTNLSPEADGCTVCPECSAAWRLDKPST